MIHVDRSRVEPPSSLHDDRVTAELERAKTFYGVPPEDRPQREFHFEAPLWSSDEVRGQLLNLFNDKCAYCESPIEYTGSVWVDLFRPKGRAIGLGGVVATDHYWWLAYEWDNLYPACSFCARHKASRFPVKEERAEPLSTGEALRREGPLLLDPCSDDPAAHLVFTGKGEVVSQTEEGRTTIEVLGLNRDYLVDARKQRYREVAAHLDGVSEDEDAFRSLAYNLLLPSQPYAAVAAQLCRAWAVKNDKVAWLDQNGPALSTASSPVSSAEENRVYRTFKAAQSKRESYSVESVGDEGGAEPDVYYAGAKRIERIEIANFKAIEDMSITFPKPQKGSGGGSDKPFEPWLMFVGENGTGKSSILKGVALALMGEHHANSLGLDPRRFVRRGAESGHVRVHLTNLSTPVELTFTTQSRRFTVKPEDPKVLLLGYGATRLLRRSATLDPDERYVRVKNLFDPTAPLNDAEAWLTNETVVDDSRFGEIALALKTLLMLGEDDEIYRKGDRVYARVYGAEVTPEELSDGFQSVVALAVDIMIALSERWSSMEVAEGTVLLDEIEVHLHPTWKIEIVDRLRRCFPRVTFIVTTHDPLCLKGLKEGEIAVLHRDEERRIIVDTSVPSTEDLKADQILTSPLFGLASTRGRGAWERTNRYIALYRKPDKTPDEEADLRALSAELGKQFLAGETPTERRAEEVLYQSALRPEREGDAPDADPMTPEVRAQLEAQLATLLSL